MEPKKGNLLIAEASILTDQSFSRTVILLTEHNKTGSVGFILNKLSSFSLKELVPEIIQDLPVYIGGPVQQNNLYFIHKIPEIITDSIEIGKGFYWGGNIQTIVENINKGTVKDNDIRFFLGYSGWDANQLEEELIINSWIVIENNFINILNADDKTLWKDQMIELGGEHAIWANAPYNPNLN